MKKILNILIEDNISELSKVISESHDFFYNCGIPENIIFNIDLILEEIITNIIKYGYEKDFDASDKSIEITLMFDNNILFLEVKDWGKPFNPMDFMEPSTKNLKIEEMKVGGLGIFLVKKLSDGFSYQRKDGCNIQRLWINV